jgi:pyrroloquinoline-quinone synthase
MMPKAFVTVLREQCSLPGRGMVNHPFVTALEAGTLTLPELRLFTEQFYLHIRNMMPWIGQIFVTCPHEDVRATLAKNLAEECLGNVTNTKAHPELMLDFGAAIGLDVEAARKAEQLVVGRRVTEYFEFMSNCRPWFVPLSAIGIGLESFVPDTFTRVVAALKKNYGISDDKLIFWTMHIMADQEHGDEGIEMVSKYAVTPRARKQVFDATVETSVLYYDLWNVFANGGNA